MNVASRPLLTFATIVLVLLTGCSSSTELVSSTTSGPDEVIDRSSGIRLVTVQEGAALQNDPPDELIILDVRTPAEFAEGHLEGAIMIDFYRDDFSDQLAELEPDAPYLLYCRSGNRSGQTTALMSDLGFSDVADLDGGILSWTEAGLPTVTD